MSEVELTSPERVLFPEDGFTKSDLVTYYEAVSERMFPLVQGRPLTLLRCPNGYAKNCFFQKHPQSILGPGLAPVELQQIGRRGVHLQLISSAGLKQLVQHGVLEIHIWGSRAADVERPDQIVFDLDPSQEMTWSEVLKGIGALKEKIENLGLAPFLKLSGSKGVHIHIPIVAGSWKRAHSFAVKIAKEMEHEMPEIFTANPLKKIRAGRIYLDYVRNSRGVSFIAPYSTRAKPGAPIAAPVAWDELGPRLKPNSITLQNIGRRLSRDTTDPWADFARAASPLPRSKEADGNGKKERRTRKHKGHIHA